jgi:hypothetical protein
LKSEDYIEVEKNNNNNYTILFANNIIEPNNEFIEKIYFDFINNDKSIHLYHAGMNFTNKPTVYRNFKIYNDLKRPELSKFIEELDKFNFTENIQVIIDFVVLSILKRIYEENNISKFFDKLLEKYYHRFKLKNGTNEIIKENKVLEFKCSDFFNGKTCSDNLIKDIKKKILESNNKIYLIGFDEKMKIFDSLRSNSFQDDRLRKIEEDVKNSLDVDIDIQRLPLNNNHCLLIIYVNKN